MLTPHPLACSAWAIIALSTAVPIFHQAAAQEPDPTPPTPPTSPTIISKSGPAPISQTRLLETLKSLPTKRSPIGDAAHRQGLKDTQALLLKNLTDLGYTPSLHTFKWSIPPLLHGEDSTTPKPALTPEDITFNNIYVEIKGSVNPEQVLIIGAHFDAVNSSPGADDNGTGTAAILELANVLKECKPSKTIRLMLFNLEEIGIVGAHAYMMDWLKVNKPKETESTAAPAQETVKETIIGMVSLEMLGYFSDEPDSQKSPMKKIDGVFEPPTVGDCIVVVGIAKHQSFSRPLIKHMQAGAPDLKVYAMDMLPVPIPDMMRSDHRPFIMAGIPAVMLTDTANFRNPNYHKPTDTVDTLDPKRYTLVVQGVANAIWELTR